MKICRLHRFKWFSIIAIIFVNSTICGSCGAMSERGVGFAGNGVKGKFNKREGSVQIFGVVNFPELVFAARRDGRDLHVIQIP